MKWTIGLCPRDTVSDSLKLVIPKSRIASVVKELLSVLPGEGYISNWTGRKEWVQYRGQKDSEHRPVA